ncbi:class B sortase [Breznakia pachnodae]|uniref:Sortase B n=1 Tax=Breznakia pachnodae TaxID=265178 RepID=A0ABU0E645_9FIRM|nr:class B sortase [Breznakia pachnodae]MDQ0362168.1 sortase B [Breznakia pachnodae]
MKETNKKDTFINNKKELQIKVIRGFSTGVDYVVMLIFLLLMLFGCYALWDNNQVLYEADSARYEAYKPTSTDSVSFEELQDINDEVFAWLTVYGTHIDYPVTQADDNSKYLNKNAKGEFSLAGSIYLDYENNPDFSDFNSIVYGHHMEKDAMFGNLDQFLDKDVFDKYKYGNLYVNGENHGIEFFAYLEVDAYNRKIYNPGVEGEENKEEYLSYLLSISTYTRDIGISADDQIILLSTCANETTNGRYILVGRLSDETFDDPFIGSEDSGLNNDSAFTSSSLFRIILLVILGILLLFLLLYLLMRRRKKDQEEEMKKGEDAKDDKEKN